MGGLFTRYECLGYKTLSSSHLATTCGPVSYIIRFMACRTSLANKKLSTKGGMGGGVRTLVEFSTIFSNFENYFKLGICFLESLNFCF